MAPITPADVAKAFVGYQADFDLVAAAASRAINDVTKAVAPAMLAKELNQPYPQGVPPSPMPTLKKEKGTALVPNFVGLTLEAALLQAEQNGIQIGEYQPSGPDDHASESWRVLREGHTDQDGNVYPVHRDNQLIVEWQEQLAGSAVPTGDIVYLAVTARLEG